MLTDSVWLSKWVGIGPLSGLIPTRKYQTIFYLFIMSCLDIIIAQVVEMESTTYKYIIMYMYSI